MTTMTIPDVSERTLARLRLRAALNGHTVEEEMRDILDAAADTANSVFLFSLHEALSEARECECDRGRTAVGDAAERNAGAA